MAMTLLASLRRRLQATAHAARSLGARLSGFLEPPPAHLADKNDYSLRSAQEVARFDVEEVINNLPSIFDYWSNKYLRPHLESFGYSYPEDFFAVEIAKHRQRLDRRISVVSIGAGNCDSEVRVMQLLRERAFSDVHITCVDLNRTMLARGKALAESSQLEDAFAFQVADFNDWRPGRHFDVVLANQSLHHVVNLEGLLGNISDAIGADGIFITSDMVGRNGHQRWPEALEIVQEFWKELPETYRDNVQLRRHEHEFMNWDCSVEGFEGIRSQDILPLLVERFGFLFFYAYANVICPFIDRSFGPNFDAGAQWDRDFIDRVHARDELEILAGNVKPTHLMAVMSNARHTKPTIWRHVTPEFSIRSA